MTASDIQSLNGVLTRLKDAWEDMTDDQRIMVKALVDFVTGTQAADGENAAIAAVYRPLSREEMLSSIDRGLAQADRGEGQPLSEAGADLAAEFGFLQ